MRALFLALALVACTRENPEAPAAPETGPGAIVPEPKRSPADPPASEPTRVPMTSPVARATSPAPPEETDECGASRLGAFVNLLPTADAKARIAAESGARTIRYIGPGDAVTMDYSPARLNVETGADGRIKRFRCG